MSESVFTHGEGKKRIMWAIGGLLLALLSYVILQVINPELLKVGFNLPGLTLKGAAYTDRAVGVVFTGLPSLVRNIAECTDPRPGEWYYSYRSISMERTVQYCFSVNGEDSCRATRLLSQGNPDVSESTLTECQREPFIVNTGNGCSTVEAMQEGVTSSGVCLNAFGCSSESGDKGEYYRDLINTILNHENIDNDINVDQIIAIINQESNGDINADNGIGCGLMQINRKNYGQPSCTSPRDLLSPAANIREGILLYAEYYHDAQDVINRFGNVVTAHQLALARYNSNPDDAFEQSVDCGALNGFPRIPKFACPINPGDSPTGNACSIRKYTCGISACRGF